VRGLLDMQEGTPWHYIDTRADQTVSGASSMRLTGPNPATPDQLAALQQVADKHGYYVADTGDGVSLLNAGSDQSPANGSELKARLKGGMQDEINQAMPGFAVTPGRAQGAYADLADQLAESVRGQGKATDEVIAQLKDMQANAPRMYDSLINNPAIPAKAQGNLDRLNTYGLQGVRPDYVKLLKIVAKGNLSGLLSKVSKAGGAGAIGLPAALGAYTSEGDQSQ
jgi:hypothetical protein